MQITFSLKFDRVLEQLSDRLIFEELYYVCEKGKGEKGD